MNTTQFKKKYGQYALVAGGSDGLGYAFAEAIARRGLNLVLIARQEDRLKAAATQLNETYEIDVISIAADMSDYENVKKLINSLKVSIGLAYPKLIYFNRLNKGGHFAAWEQPEIFAHELRTGFKSLR
jgi:NAD(P)-dependent dehydrogenase (short-subunit alcohol dehydrogenase family)